MNRGFLYGDGFFDTLRIWKGHPLFWNFHWTRNIETAAYLQFDTLDQAAILSLVRETANGKSGRLRLSFYRSGSGKYKPISNKVECQADFEAFDQMEPFKLQSLRPFEISSIQVPKHPSGNYKLLGRHLNVLAALDQKEGVEALLLNNDDELTCGIACNIFIHKDSKWFTPSLESGCLNGTMRSWLVDTFQVEQTTVILSDLENADLILLSNSIVGLIPIKMAGNFQPFYSNMMYEINRAALNSIAGLQES